MCIFFFFFFKSELYCTNRYKLCSTGMVPVPTKENNDVGFKDILTYGLNVSEGKELKKKNGWKCKQKMKRTKKQLAFETFLEQ